MVFKMKLLDKLIYRFVIIFMISIPLFKFISYVLYFKGVILNSYDFNHVYVLWISLPILVIFYIISMISKKINYIDIILYFLIILAFVSTFLAQDINISIFGETNRNEGLLTILNYYFVFLNIKNLSDKRYKYNIVKIFLILGVIQVIYSIFQVYTNFDFIKHFSKEYMAMGLCGNPNFFGSYMVMLVLISSTLYLLKDKIIYFVLSLIYALGLFLANSTAPFIGFVLGLIFLIIFSFKNINKINLIKLITLFIILFFINDYTLNLRYETIKEDNRRYNIKYEITDTVNSIVSKNNEYNYGSSRIKLWKNLIPVAKKYYLFGAGLDNLRVVYPKDKGLVYDKAHNIYYQILITNGIFALSIYCLLCLIIFIKGFKIKDNLYIALYVAFVGYSIQAFGNISVIDVAPYFFIILGLLYSKDNEIVI